MRCCTFSTRLAKANRASQGPRVRAKARGKKTRENRKENPKEPKVRTKVLKAHTRAKHRKLVSQVARTRNRKQVLTLRNLHRHVLDISWKDGWNGDEWNDGRSFDEWNDDWSSGRLHEGWEQTYDTSATSFSLGGLDFSVTCSPKPFEWVKMNLETGAAGNTFSLNFAPEVAGDGRYYRTASGDWIPDGGAWQFQGYDENGFSERKTHWCTQSFVLQRSRAKDDRCSTSSMTVTT